MALSAFKLKKLATTIDKLLISSGERFNQAFSFFYYTKKQQKTDCIMQSVHRAWQRPTLPGPCGPSTIGAGGLNGRVRDGNAWFPSAIVTKRDLAMRKNRLFRAYTLKTGYEHLRSCLAETLRKSRSLLHQG